MPVTNLNMNSFESLLDQYDYHLEKDNISPAPAVPRDSAKLLVYDRATRSVQYDTFANLVRYLPENALIIFNDTKVIPARVYLEKKTGGKVEVLAITHDVQSATIEALANRRLEVGDMLYVDGLPAAEVLEVGVKEYRLKLLDPHLLEKKGTTPIPPYLKHTPLTEEELRVQYQTIFAKYAGSSAAPTASLHFTDELMQRITDSGREIAYVTLHVGLGTFAPLTEDAIATGTLHHEQFFIPKETVDAIEKAKSEGRPIIAVGTTALRALETAWADPSHVQTDGETRIFIREGYTFKCVTGLITNFHVPRSSLLMLVATLVGREKLLELYSLAREHGFKFLSFGDGMLIV